MLSQLEATYHVRVRPAWAQGETSLQALYGRVLSSHFADICEPSIPRDLHAQITAQVPKTMLLQVVGARDATQPLRPCADMSEEEIFLMGAPGQAAANKNRLLRLVLTDGHLEISAIELRTNLKACKSVPIPGEKILVFEGAQVRHGHIILSESMFTFIGGSVDQLRREYEGRRSRNVTTIKGTDGAPKFEPLDVRESQHHSQHYHHSHDAIRPNHSSAPPFRGGPHSRGSAGPPGRGRGATVSRGSAARGRGGRGGRSGHGVTGRGGYERQCPGADLRPPQPEPTRHNQPPVFCDEDFPMLGDY